MREGFVNLVLQLALEQPLKTPFVAAVVLVVNTLQPDIVREILANTSATAETKIKEGQWRDVKLCLKLLACLQSCLSGDGVFPVLDELFNRAGDLQTASSDDVGFASPRVGPYCCLSRIIQANDPHRLSAPSSLR